MEFQAFNFIKQNVHVGAIALLNFFYKNWKFTKKKWGKMLMVAGYRYEK